MAFIGELKYKKSKNDEESFAGRPFYVLSKKFAYENSEVKEDYIVECPKGYTTDFASIPEYFWFLDPKDERWQRAAVIHDRACKIARESNEQELSMKEADNYLYHAMIECGSGKFAAYTFYLWVRAKHVLYNRM